VDTLDGQIAHSYSQHPQFRFEQQELELDPVRLAAFNDVYLLVRAYGSRLTGRQFEACVRDCNSALAEIFAHLKAQSAEPHERLFLQELQAECGRLVQEELRLFHSTRLHRGVSLEDSRTRANALSLGKERHFFGRLSSDAVREILEIGADDLEKFREAVRQGRLRREDLSLYQGPNIRSILHILNRDYRTQGVLDVLAAYAGRRLWAGGVSLELSVPQSKWWANSFKGLPRAPRTLYAHLDEAIGSPKSIVYLSEVDQTTGPTSCYPGAYEALALNPLQEAIGRVVGNVGSAPDSPLRAHYAKQYHQAMSSEAFRRHFMKLPAVIRFNSHLGWDVLPDTTAEQFLTAHEHFMLGAPGTYIVFDGGRLLHRGGMPDRGERIALQVVFSPTSWMRRAVRRIRRVFP